MALTITKLKMWKDPGYTRNCPEMPPVGSKKLPAAPDYTLAADETLRPHKGSTLTELHLPLSFTQTFGMSYLYIEATDGAGSVSLFGWITSIEQRSTAAEGITLRWDVDWWRSYSGNVTFKSGIITKSPDSTHSRPYRTQPRYWKVKSVTEIKEGGSTSPLWCYMPTVWTTTSANYESVSKIVMVMAPIDASFERVPGGTVFSGPTLAFLYNGLIDEMLAGMSTSTTTINLVACYIAPIAPDDWTWDGSKWACVYDRSYATITNADNMSIIIPPGTSDPTITASLSITSVMTTDTKRIGVADCNGNICGYLPYGIGFTNIQLVLDVGPSGAYLDVSFISSSLFDSMTNAQKRKSGVGMGCSFTVPMIPLSITENAWSDYVVSGQRDHDITSARIANEQKAIAGIETTIQSGIGGAIAGASAGPFGAIGGAIGGLVGEGIMTAVNYGLGENFNKQLQEATDQLYANQKNGIAISGGSYNKAISDDAFYPLMIVEEADSVSTSEFSADISQNGYDVNVSGSLSITGSTTGAYRIINMTLTGNVPPQAKQYIKDKFEQGIRLIENNPSGVAP